METWVVYEFDNGKGNHINGYYDEKQAMKRAKEIVEKYGTFVIKCEVYNHLRYRDDILIKKFV